MKARLTLVVALLLVCIGTGATMAQTPDGDPPSQETICDNETGAAYGLCNAFCEAMDCESDDPQASAMACDKVKSKYQQITGQEPPCLQQQSQCVCNEELPGFLDAVNSEILRCLNTGVGVILETSSAVVISEVYSSSFAFCNLDFGQGGFLQIAPKQSLHCQDFLRSAAAAAGVACNP